MPLNEVTSMSKESIQYSLQFKNSEGRVVDTSMGGPWSSSKVMEQSSKDLNWLCWMGRPEMLFQ